MHSLLNYVSLAPSKRLTDGIINVFVDVTNRVLHCGVHIVLCYIAHVYPRENAAGDRANHNSFRANVAARQHITIER